MCYGCFTILIVYQSMLSSFMSYAKVLVRPDDPGTDRGLLCFRACSSVLLVHPKCRRPGDARVVTSCTSVVLGYAGSFGYDCAPRCDWGRRQEVTIPSVCRNSVLRLVHSPTFGYGVGVIQRCNGTGCTPVRDILPVIPFS